MSCTLTEREKTHISVRVMNPKTDKPKVFKLIQSFQTESFGKSGVLGTPDEATIGAIIDNCWPCSFVLCEGEKILGVLAGQIGYNFMNQGDVYQEIVWFVNKKYRGKGVLLYLKAKEFAKRLGLSGMVMASLFNDEKAFVDRFYKSQGFVPLETHHYLSLE